MDELLRERGNDHQCLPLVVICKHDTLTHAFRAMMKSVEMRVRKKEEAEDDGVLIARLLVAVTVAVSLFLFQKVKS